MINGVFIMFKSYFVLTALILILCFGTAYTQTPSISGTVEDAAKAAVQGATVILRNKKTGAETVVVTDADGKFAASLPVGSKEFEVIVSAKGFARFSREATDSDSNLTLTLTPGPL